MQGGGGCDTKDTAWTGKGEGTCCDECVCMWLGGGYYLCVVYLWTGEVLVVSHSAVAIYRE